MLKRGILFGFFVVFASFIMLIAGVSAEIFISQPGNLYNLGDSVNLKVTVTPGVDSAGFLKSILVCGSTAVEIFRTPLSLDSGQSKEFDIDVRFDRFLAGGLSGECYIAATFIDESVSSQKFTLSKDIDVSLDISEGLFDPGQTFVVGGSATKSNGQPLEGFVEIFIDNIGKPEVVEETVESNESESNGTLSEVKKTVGTESLNVSGSVSGGTFSFEFKIPEDAKSGNHMMKARVYDRDSSGEVINEGKANGAIKVRQIVKSLDIAIGQQNVLPGDNIDYTVLLSDQAKEVIEKEVGINVYDPKGAVYLKRLVNSGESNSVSTAYNASPGYWKIEGFVDDFSRERLIYVEELEKAEFIVENGTLTVSNSGNVEYKKPVEISIGGIVEVKEIRLDVGETKRLRLVAPDGEYSIGVNDGEVSEDLGSVFLTGRAIAVREGDGLSGSLILGFWIILALILISLLVYYLKDKVKKNPGLMHKDSKGIVKVSGNQEKKPKITPGPEVGMTSHIDGGKKEDAGVVALKLYGFKAHGKSGRELDEALRIAKNNKAKIYIDGDYRIIIFTKSVTGHADNSGSAIKVAKDIKKRLEAYALTDKGFSFGVGVHVGPIAVELKDDKFRFSSLENTVSMAKRVSGKAHGEILMSGKAHSKLMGGVKSEKVGGQDLWKVKRVVNREGHSDFIHRFLDRQDYRK